MIEVEVKYRLDDPDGFERLLVSRFGAEGGNTVSQTDIYFNHPCVDYDSTDEAVRVRTVASADGGQRSQLCYKGPRLDRVTKTRRELECSLEGNSATHMIAIFEALGFTTAGTMQKNRQSFQVVFEGQQVVAAIDQVDGLGCFAELEIVCEDSARLLATEQLLRLTAELGLREIERRSYLELLEIQGTR